MVVAAAVDPGASSHLRFGIRTEVADYWSHCRRTGFRVVEEGAVAADGWEIGEWAQTLIDTPRSRRDPELVAQLDIIGFVWRRRREPPAIRPTEAKLPVQWVIMPPTIKRWLGGRPGHIPPSTVDMTGLRLGEWVCSAASAWREGHLDQQRAKILIGLNVSLSEAPKRARPTRPYLDSIAGRYVPQRRDVG